MVYSKILNRPGTGGAATDQCQADTGDTSGEGEVTSLPLGKGTEPPMGLLKSVPGVLGGDV